MELLENVSLKPFNTFGVNVKAHFFTEAASQAQIVEIVKSGLLKKHNSLILGGGSNILFTKDFDGLVVKIANKGIEVVHENDHHTHIKSAAGEVWDDLVKYSVENGWGGLENLFMIPGNVGSSPIQNIGAYGVELKDHFHELSAINIETGEVCNFSPEQCKFDYRDSIFKQEFKGKYIILSVTFRLDKQPALCLDYGNIRTELEAMGVEKPDIRQVSDAVRQIRSAKLPDPVEIGNAGSFFKNPVVGLLAYNELLEKFDDIVAFPVSEGWYKISAGWLIERAGYKGFRQGDAGVYKNQALVLVNYGNASGSNILNLAGEIIESVKSLSGIALEPEVNIV